MCYVQLNGQALVPSANQLPVKCPPSVTTKQIFGVYGAGQVEFLHLG